MDNEDVKLSRKAADQGDSESVKWHRKAADQGYAAVQFNFGLMYAYGEGVVKNGVEAYKWWLLARAKGSEEARTNMNILERRLTPDQRAEGQRLAREWTPRSH